MRINNAIEFFHFIRSNALTNISPDTIALIQCVEEYGRMCSCDPEAVRNAKLNQCRRIYSAFLSRAPQFKEQLLSKVPDGALILGVDGQIVTTITR